jgi:O-antigen/teichoic acid export membrane protein
MVMPLKMVGIYKVYKEIATIIERVGSPVNQAVFPEYTKLIGGNQIERSVSTTKETMLLLGGVSLVLTAILMLASNFIVERFFGGEYLIEINALYFMLILFGISLVLLPINSLFIAAGFAKLSFYIVSLCNVIYFLFAFFLGGMMGLYGLVSAYGVQLLLNIGLKVSVLIKYSTGWNTEIR